MSKFSPLEKAAIILVSLGEDLASEILRHLDERQVKRLARQMGTLQRVDQATVQAVLEEFALQLSSRPDRGVRGEADLTRSIVEKAFGTQRSTEILSGIGLELAAIQDLIADIDTEPLAHFLDRERPQVAAAVLSLVPVQRRVQVFMKLDSLKRVEILTDIAQLAPLSAEAIEELSEQLRELSERASMVKKMRVGGPEVAAQILNQLDSGTAHHLLDQLEEVDAELAAKIKELMFGFGDLIRIEDRHMQKLLAKVDRALLVKALKKADTAITEHILRNVSARVREDIMDRLAALPAMRISEVEQAQNQIVSLARSMEEKGEIEIRSPQDIYV